MKVYLDTCCLCRPYDDLSNSKNKIEADSILHILDWIDLGKLDWIKSEFLEFEIAHIRSASKREKIQKFLEYNEFEFVFFNDLILNGAKELSQLGFHRADSIHVMSALEGNADVFLSTDDGLIKKGQKNGTVLKLKFFNPSEFIYGVK